MNSIEKFVSLPQNGTSSAIRVLGIDLGTTNSTVAEVIWKPGEAPVCNVLELTQPTEAGEYTSPLIPSVLAQLPDHTVWIGEGAKRLRAFPQNRHFHGLGIQACDLGFFLWELHGPRNGFILAL